MAKSDQTALDGFGEGGEVFRAPCLAVHIVIALRIELQLGAPIDLKALVRVHDLTTLSATALHTRSHARKSVPVCARSMIRWRRVGFISHRHYEAGGVEISEGSRFGRCGGRGRSG